MIELEYFKFKGDHFYVNYTEMPLNTPGLTFFRGQNLDAKQDGAESSASSNGTGKSRLVQLLEGFIFGSSSRGHFKRMVTPNFEGTLAFKTLKDGHSWEFTYKVASGWQVVQNGTPISVSHKATDCRALLQKTLGLTENDWSYFMSITARSLDTLIKGKPKEKRLYLEEFFNIDEFYENKYNDYLEQKKALAEEVELIRTDRQRLFDLQLALDAMSGAGWLEIQVNACDEVLTILKRQQGAIRSESRTLSDNIGSWNSYQELYIKLQGVDEKTYQDSQQAFLKEKALAGIALDNLRKLETFISQKFVPHRQREPKCTLTQPAEACPTNESITSKSLTVKTMRDKIALKKSISALSAEIEEIEIPHLSSEQLEQLRAEQLKKQLEARDHLSLIEKGGDVCPTCRRPLDFILADVPKEVKLEILRKQVLGIDAALKLIGQQLKSLETYEKLQAKLSLLTEQFNKFPTFGTKLSVAEADLIKDTRLVAQWDAYSKEKDAYTQWKSKLDLLLVEAKSLGYPNTESKESYEARIKEIDDNLSDIGQVLKNFEQFRLISEKVINLPPLVELEEKIANLLEQDTLLGSHIDDLNVLKGSYKEKRDMVISYQAQIDAAKKRLARQDETESAFRQTSFLTEFYSYKGFKLYELKQRCKALVERSNYWSKFFFQEDYLWSMAEDLENLDLLVQPLKHKDVEPYSVSSFSSGEYNRAARVLLFSQLELIPPNKKTNLLFLDEVEGNLDKAGMRAFVEDVLPKLRETFPEKCVVIISHTASLSSSQAIDHLWLAERKDRKTNLTVYPYYQRRN